MNDNLNILENYFDKIFVVSIPRFEERHKLMVNNLNGLKFDFFWGADKKKLDEATLIIDKIYDDAKAKKNQRQGKGLSIGEIACSLSHKMIYEEMIKNNWQKVLVLEDDAKLINNNLHALPNIVTQLPPDWELVYFGYLKHEQVTPALKRKQFFYKIISTLGLMKWTRTMTNNMLPKNYSTNLKIAGFHDCTHAYAITLNAAKKLLQAQTPVVYRADDLLSHTILKGNLKAFVTEPKIFDQEGFVNAELVSEIKGD